MGRSVGQTPNPGVLWSLAEEGGPRGRVATPKFLCRWLFSGFLVAAMGTKQNTLPNWKPRKPNPKQCCTPLSRHGPSHSECRGIQHAPPPRGAEMGEMGERLPPTPSA